ncbi:MAG TPA: ATP-binding protein [Planctomycetota bacterium]|nr:ATP-binding protein [Planctomycetota bacterium]
METLIFIAGLQQGERYELHKDLVRLGRERFNDLTVDDEGASRAHAEIRRKSGSLTIRDLGSTNGTYVNNRRITECALSDGDRVSIGTATMLVEVRREPTAAAPGQAVLFHEGEPAEVTTQFRLSPEQSGFLSPSRMRADVRAQENFQRLYRFMVRIGSPLTVSTLLDTVMEEIFEATGADRGFVLLAGDGGELRPTAVRTRKDRAVIAAAGEITVSKRISRHVLEKGESLMITEAGADKRFADTSAFGAGSVQSVIAAPLKSQDKTAGLIYLDTLTGGRLFNQTDLELVTAMAVGAASALDNVRLYEKLMNATEYSAAVLRSLSSGLLVADTGLVIGKVNRAALELLGLEEMELTGRKLDALPGLGEMAAAARRAMDEGQAVEHAEIEIRVGDRTVPAELSVGLMTHPSGRASGAVLSFRDLSQIRKLAEQVKRQEHLASLGEMAAGVAHEIRNPLSSIRGFAQIMSERLARESGGAGPAATGAPGPSAAECMSIIIEEVDRMNGIVQDLLDFARQRQLTMARLALAEVSRSVLAQLAGEAATLGIAVTEEYEPGLPQAYGNEAKLRQVFLNVAKNALEAMAGAGTGGGRLTVRTGQSPAPGGAGRQELFIAFQDTGPGMTREVLARIFDPFFTTKDVGTGLGLAICAKIIDAHGGRIEVQSEPGQGATFTIFLPAPRKGGTDRFPAVGAGR